MEVTYNIILLAILFSSMVSGFITFRMHGMRLAPNFVMIILALILTLVSIIIANSGILYAAALFQILAAVTAFTQTWHMLKYNFQTAPAYAPHLTLMAMLPVLAIASIL
ncbi:DUF5400 domain-containing protein [Methanobacterium sp. ACI-7]|uniref:DUF5400 domain-containing protein n=1 Tax=unclassified Methanobacterium TaxID=2627676 RepID=UPI0039C482D9